MMSHTNHKQQRYCYIYIPLETDDVTISKLIQLKGDEGGMRGWWWGEGGGGGGGGTASNPHRQCKRQPTWPMLMSGSIFSTMLALISWNDTHKNI